MCIEGMMENTEEMMVYILERMMEMKVNTEEMME